MRLPRILFAVAGLSAVSLEAAGMAAERSADAATYFSGEEIARGAARARQYRIAWLATMIWSAAVLVVLAHPRVGSWFVRIASRFVGASGPTDLRAVAAAALAIALMLVAYVVLRVPFAWVRGYALEHAWGLSTQSVHAWLWDWAKGLAVSVAVFTVALAAVVTVRSYLPSLWPVAAWATTSAVIALAVLVWPVVVDPLFHAFRPVDEPELVERVRAVAGRAGLEVGDVLWVDAHTKTRRTNAYFTGLGATKRIVLYDTLRDDLGAIDAARLDEIETIVAHEAGHWKHGHMWKGTLLSIAALGAFFALVWGVTRVGGAWLPAPGLPGGARLAPAVLLAALVAELVSMPVANAVSRRWERTADREALALSSSPEAFVRAEVELARRNISEIEPGSLTVFWLYSHPPVLERIRMGEAAVARSRSPAEGG
jgi:STE24 endopeptidase